jgi:hypothetical protein
VCGAIFERKTARAYIAKPGGRNGPIGRSAPGVPAITASVMA